MPRNLTLDAFLLILVYDSVSMAANMKIYWVAIMEYSVQLLMWEEIGARGRDLNKKGNGYQQVQRN